MNQKILKEASLVLLQKDNTVLLGLKTKKIGVGCWNGYGGGLEEGETIEECALREMFEESGVTISKENLTQVAIVNFHNNMEDGGTFICKVHFFVATEWDGVPQESEEMIKPTFFDIENLPFDQMMPGDNSYFPHLFSGKKIIGDIHYGPNQKTLLREPMIREVEAF